MPFIKNILSKLKSGVTDVFFANVFNKAVAMLCTVVITRLLSKSDYGIWSYVGNWYMYFTFVSGGGMLNGALQFGTEKAGEDKEYSIFKYCIPVGCFINLALSIAFLIFSCFTKFSIANSSNFLRAYIPLIILEFGLTVLLLILRCENRIKEYARIVNINTVLQGLGMCLGALWGLWGIIIGRYLSFVISIIQTCCHIPNEVAYIRNATRLSKSEIRSIWHFSFFSGIASSLNCLMTVMDISVISYIIKDPVEVAYYRQAAIIPNSLGIIPTSVIIALLPNFIANYKNKEWTKKFAFKLYSLLGTVNICVCCFLWIFAPQIIWILSGKGYENSIPSFRILVLTYFIGGTFRALSVNLLSAMKKVNFTLTVAVVASISDIVLNFVFVDKFGIIGAAYATLGVVIIASILSTFYMIFVVKREK